MTAAIAAYHEAVRDQASWRPSSDPCPIKMTPLPPEARREHRRARPHAARFGCMANVDARSSPSVTSLATADRAVLMWITLDLKFQIDRQIAAAARAIAPPEDLRREK